MKQKSLIPALGVLFLVGAASMLLDPTPESESGSERGTSTASSAPAGKIPDREPRRIRDAAAPDARPLPELDFKNLATVGAPLHLLLPDGRTAVGTVDQIRVDEEDGWSMISGVLTQPADGRFAFLRQPEGTPSGRYAGAIRLPEEIYGYRLDEGPSGSPRLTRHDADVVSCVHYPMPPAPDDLDEPRADLRFLLPYEHPTDITIPDYQNGVIPLESLPGALGVIYLDFDGEEGPHQNWGDFDAAPSGATNPQIIDVWSRVAEDFSPFNINVTTDLQVYLDAPETSRQRCIVTPTTNAAPGAGGVAYGGSWNWNGDTPCWAFYSTGKAAAEVISHELGHTLGLAHDGQTTGVEYYGGHGGGATGWAPIMGVGYYQNLTQWSKGEYLDANQTQDDLAVMDGFNSVDLRADDSGDDTAGASPLELYGTTADDDGVISSRDDVDVYSFTTTGGTLSLHIAPVSAGPNLDIRAEIRNSSDGVVASSNPDAALDATFTNLNLAAGTYTVRIDGVGRGSPTGDGYTDYASVGHYSIDGTINGAIYPDRFSVNEFPPLGSLVGTVTPDNNHGANPLAFSITSGNSGGAFAIGTSTGTLTVANPAQFNHDHLSSGWNDPAEFELFVEVTDSTQPALSETLRVIVTVIDTDAVTPVALAHRYSFTSDASDSIGNADLTMTGTTSILSGQLNLPGGAARTNHAAAQGAALTEIAATIHNSPALTIECWFNQDAALDWAKLFMAGAHSGNETGIDYMDITPRRLVDGNASSMSIRNDGDAESHAIGATPLVNNAKYYFAATWDGPADLLTLRIGPVGGALQTFTASMNGRDLADIDINEFYLGSAVYWPDPDFDGQIDEFRIWNGALSNDKAASNFAIGPNPADDSDIDGLPDTWELSFAAVTSLSDLDGNLSAGGGPGAASGDFDGDGLSDAEEYNGGDNSTDPTDSDSDNDGFPDPLELILGTDPNDINDKPGAVLAHRYSFNTDASDVVGHADLDLIGTSSVTGGGLELPGGAPRTNHARATGDALAELADTIHNSYAITIETWYRQDTANNWAKVLMAGQPSGFNYMDITPRRGETGNFPSISLNNGGTEVYAVGGVSVANNTPWYCAAVWDPLLGQVRLTTGPVGGVLQTHTVPTNGRTLADLNIAEFRIGAAVQFNDPDFDGRIDELRIWRGALSGSEVAASFIAGPGQPPGDIDADGLDDAWEFTIADVNHLDDIDPGDDLDNDGLTNLDEFHEGTDPKDADSDNDGFTDGFEVAQETDPNDINDKPVIPPTTLAHRYSFTTDASDPVGGADLTLIGSANVEGGTLVLPGGSSRSNCASALGASLPILETTVRDSVALSMEGWFRQSTAQNWSKLFMAGRGSGGEYLDITPRRGISGNVASISFNDGNQESTAIGSGSPLSNDVDYYCAAVWDPVTDQLTISIGPVGGTLSTHTASLGGRSLTTVAINEFYLGAAVQFPDPDFHGRIDEFRIWSGALDGADIARHFAAGPDAFSVAPVIESIAMNAAKDTLTLVVSGLVPTQAYHLQDGISLDDFDPVAESGFIAAETSATIPIPIDPTTVPKRFFRIAEGAP